MRGCACKKVIMEQDNGTVKHMPAEMTLDDVYDMAIEIETDGEAFYLSAASACNDPEQKRILADLGAMEADHRLVFAALKDHAAKNRPARDAKELSLVAKLFATGVKEDLARRFTGRETSKEILQKALDFEKDTIVFFLSMKHMLDSGSDKSKVDEIVTEELGHVITLSSALAQLMSTPPSQPALPAQPDDKAGQAT